MRTPISILVVEDNVINQKVVCKMLERLQISAVVAVNGKTAVQMYSDHRFELVFMDIQMPEMDGLEATKAIRALQTSEQRPVIIALTANAMLGDRERCLQAGMDDYLAKPIKQQDIESVIAKWFPAVVSPEQGSPPSGQKTAEMMIDPKRIDQIKEIGENELLQELLTLYLDDLDQFTLCVAAAATVHNHRQIYECSHKLKGSSANLGIESIREACKTMETFAHQNDDAGISDHFIHMQRLMDEVKTYITRTYLS